MRTRAVAAMVAAVLGTSTLVATGVAAADTGPDLWVIPLQNCSDQGPGTVAAPFCTVQRAAEVAEAGDTVHVTAGDWGELDVTHSGRPGAPITFLADQNNGFLGPFQLGVDRNNGVQQHAVAMHGVHDIVVRGNFQATGLSSAVLIDNSTDVTVDGMTVYGNGSPPPASDGIDITGASARITLSRNDIEHRGAAGIAVGAGVTGAVVTTNVLANNAGPGIQVTDSAAAVITSNTVLTNCPVGISLTGASAGASIQNNVLSGNGVNRSACKTGSFAELSVAATATAGTTAAYNLFGPAAKTPYRWADTTYADPAAFAAGTGQGAHDLVGDPMTTHPKAWTVQNGSPVIDSANDTAPGELASDLTHSPRVDDPLVAGIGTHDRGAVELPDPFAITQLTVTPDQGPHPLPVTASVQVSNPWSTPLSYTYDFQDGSPVVTTDTSVTHVYQQRSGAYPYLVSVTATAPSGVAVHDTGQALVTDPAPEVARLSAFQDEPLRVITDASASTDA
ncbi:LigA protein [Kutzneria sp. 744]|nr:LigA protein [Kutzneria sp. 744]